MILSDIDIRNAIDSGTIVIEPKPEEAQFATSSLDVRLGEEMFRYQTADEYQEKNPKGLVTQPVVNPDSLDSHELFETLKMPVPKDDQGRFILGPGKFALGVTLEYIRLPRESCLAARMKGAVPWQDWA